MPARFPLMGWLLCVFLVWSTTWTAIAAEEARWLFVVDTSISMRKKHENTIKIVQELFADEFNHLIRENEKIDLWTFREQLNTNAFAGISWSAKEKKSSSVLVTQFLKGQRYTGRTRLFPVVEAIQNEAFKSRVLIAFLITDGDDDIKGTPFDGPLNGDFLLYRSNLRRTKMPFVTMLVYQRGFCVAARVHPGAGKIAIPLQRQPDPRLSLPPEMELQPEDISNAGNQNPVQSSEQAELNNTTTEALTSGPSLEPVKETLVTDPPAVASISTNNLSNVATPERSRKQDSTNEILSKPVQEGKGDNSKESETSESIPKRNTETDKRELSRDEVPSAGTVQGKPTSSLQTPQISEASETSVQTPGESNKGKRYLNRIVFGIGLMAAAGLVWVSRKRRTHTSLISESFSRK